MNFLTFHILENQNVLQRLFCLGKRSEYQKTIQLQRHASDPDKTEEQSEKHLFSHEKTSDTFVAQLIKKYYAPFIMRRSTKLVVLLVYLIYISSAIYGCAKLENGLQPTRLMLDDSPVVHFYNIQEEYFWKLGTQAQVAFTNPGNVSDPVVREKIFKIIRHFANSKHGMGTEGVDFWMNAFSEHLESNGAQLERTNGKEFYDQLNFYLSFDEYAFYRNDIHWENATIKNHITAFR